MARTTGIAWARSTFNPWWGCQAVSPGCDHCYAEAWAKRTGRDFNKRTRTSVANWRQPLKWNRIAAFEKKCEDWHTPGFWPVFPSLCDPFDNEADAHWRDDFFTLIERTQSLTWLLLTKRIGNVRRYTPWSEFPPNAWIGISIVNQEEADRDIPKLLDTPAAKRFVSYEPALGPVDFTALDAGSWTWDALRGTGTDKPHVPAFLGATKRATIPIHDGRHIDQIIVGGESTQGGQQARPFDIEWARSTVRQCKQAGVAVFVKQLGSAPYIARDGVTDYRRFTARAGADPAEWPEDLRVQEFPA